ncbi:MAG: type-F conjugative transfer system secretin TraK [Candidatus Obscuribacterales bacterium]
MRKALLSLLLAGASLPLSAAVFFEVDSAEVKTCTFSSRYHNRIGLSSGKIKKVICPEGHLAISMEEESGQAFIQALPHSPNPAILSVVTSDGIVQDLQIAFEEKPTEVVILSPPAPAEQQVNQAATPSSPLLRLSHTINEILKKQCPADCSWKPLYGHPCKLPSKACLTPCYALFGPEGEIRVFRLRNPTKRTILVREHQLSFRGGEWVYIEEPSLAPGQSTRVLVGMDGGCL